MTVPIRGFTSQRLSVVPFPHCPQYPQAAYSDRVIAIQARILCTTDEMMVLQKSYHCTSNPSEVLVMVSECVSKSMRDCPFVVPSLEEVMVEFDKLL